MIPDVIGLLRNTTSRTCSTEPSTTVAPEVRGLGSGLARATGFGGILLGLQARGITGRVWSWAAVARLTAVLVVVLAFGPAGVAYAQGGEVVAPDAAASISDPGTSLGVPADGRLRGYQFAAQVLGVATGSRLDQGGGVMVAAAGQRLWVFGLRATLGTDANGDAYPVTATLVVDGTRLPVPLSQISGLGGDENSTVDTGDMYWVASVPADARDVALELAGGGLAQTFSFTRMAREGPQPAVLYRDPNGWQVSQPLADQQDVPTPDPTGDVTDAFLPVTLSGLTLSWFGPDDPSDVPAGNGQAWLVPALSSITYQNSDNGLCYPSLPASDVTLTLPGSAPISATVFPGLGHDMPHYGAFTAVYGFKVPSTITTATLTVAPGTFQAMTSVCTIPVTVTAQRSATFDIDLPAASPAAIPAGAALVAPPIHDLAPLAASSKAGATDSHSSFPVGLVAVLAAAALAVALGLLAVNRRRHRSGATATTNSLGSTTPAPATSTVGAADPETQPLNQPSPPGTSLDGRLEVVLIVPPTQAPPLFEGQVEVQIIGTPHIAGWPVDVAAPGQSVAELLTFLALHPDQRFSAEQLRDRLGPGRPRDLDAASIRRYLGELRRVLGEDHVPEARGAGGYTVNGISTDTGRFADLVSDARTAESPAETAGYLADALTLVRGAPFAERPAGSYGWAETGSNIAAVTANAVLNAAVQLGELATAAGDSELALWAVERGLLVWPTDETLHQLALTAAARAGGSRLERIWAQIRARLDVEGEVPSHALSNHYHRLREETQTASA